MRKVFIQAALAALLAVCLAVPAGAQGFSSPWGCTVNGWPCWLAYPAAADNGKALTYDSTLKQGVWSSVTETDGVIGNEVLNATDATLTRSGSGTAGSPYTLGLNLGNANTWTATQTFGATANPSIAGASNADLKLFSSGTGGTLWGTVTTVGSLTACTSNGTTTIAKAAHGLTLLAGDTVRVTNATTAADVGFYRLVSSTAGTLVVSRALAGSDADVALTVYRTGMALGPNGRLYNTSSLTGSSGTMFGTAYSPQVNQSGTAGYTALYVDATQTATGSGTKRLLDLAADGTSMFSVSSAGAVTGVDSTWNKPNITTTLTAAVSLANVTPATVGVPIQQSPAIRLEGHGWDTDGNDDKWEWYIYQAPSSGSTTTSLLTFGVSKAGAAAIAPMTLSSGGAIQITSGLTASSLSTTSSGTYVANTQLKGKSAMTLEWSSTTSSGGATDLGLSRNAANVLEVTTGTAGTADGRVVARNYMVQLTADATIQFGNVVMPDAGTDGRFDVLTADSTLGIGVLTGVGPSAAGTTYNIAVDGIAYVAPAEDQAITRGQHLCISGTVAGVVTSSAGICAQGKTIGKSLYSEPVTYVIAPAGCGGSCVNTTSETITLSSAPGWAVNDPVIYYNSGGTSIGGLTDGATYWVRSISGADVTLKALKTDTAAINLTSAGDDATQYLIRLPQAIINVQ